MLKQLRSFLVSYFVAHPDVLSESHAESPKGKSYLQFLWRNHEGRAHVLFLVASITGWVVGFLITNRWVNLSAIICTWVFIRAIGRHHSSWRKRALEESREETYRGGRDQALRHGPVPHYAHIASAVFFLMAVSFLAKLAWIDYAYYASQPVSHCDEGFEPGMSRWCLTPSGERGMQVCDVASGIQSHCTPIDGFDPSYRDADPPIAGGLHVPAPCGGDPSVGTPCSTGIGSSMNSGTLRCVGNELICDVVSDLPTSETCDNLDNDGDGAIDNDVTHLCYPYMSGLPGIGVCRMGTQTCTAGVFARCAGAIGPSAEICDGIDNDCDGGTDELVCP